MSDNKYTRKDALKAMGGFALGSITYPFLRPPFKKKRPNIVVIMCDQFRADVCKREGFELDTTPFLDRLAENGTWFNKAYTSAPACVPARASMLTGRFPNATRVKSNHNIQDATFEADLIDVVKSQGYRTALVGKNHSYLKPDKLDYWSEYGHLGEREPDSSKEKAFNKYLRGTSFYAEMDPAPFPAEMQQPARIVRDAESWIGDDSKNNSPFFLWMSIPEPHNPYQVSEPYYSMFPPETLPKPLAGSDALSKKGNKYVIQKKLMKMGYPNVDKQIPRIRSNYFGMMRLIDDQIKKFVSYLKRQQLYEDTVIVFLADHGDYAGEYGLIKKGAGVPECLTRIPMFWHGPGIQQSRAAHPSHVSITDIMPTICDMIGTPLPEGVQGRSLWPMLQDNSYPTDEFDSVIVQQGFGGLDYKSIDELDPYKEGCLVKGETKFNELNSWSQSGILRMLRKGDWKLVYDMQGRGKMYNLAEDRAELNDLFDESNFITKKMELIQDMLAWELKTQDPLPLPRKQYVFKRGPKNYWAPYK